MHVPAGLRVLGCECGVEVRVEAYRGAARAGCGSGAQALSDLRVCAQVGGYHFVFDDACKQGRAHAGVR